MTKAVLKILDSLKGFFVWLGADFDQLRCIVEIKFKMQNRRPAAIFANRYKSTDKDPNNAFWGLAGLMAFIGLFMGMIMFAIDAPYYGLLISFSYILIMSVMLLVNDFSTTLLDTTDNFVILPRPVNGRTLLLARLVHIVSYVMVVSFSISFFPLIFTIFKYGLLAVGISVVLVLQSAMLAVFLTSLLYMLLMRFTTEERLKDIISYFQIAFTVFISVGYQFMGRMFDADDYSSAISVKAYHYLVPPLWMSGTVEYFKNGTEGTWPFVVLALGVPLVCLWVLVKYLAPAYNKQMVKLGSADAGGGERLVSQKRRNWVNQLAEVVTGNTIEKAIFELSWKITARDRQFKMRAYPSFAMLIPIVFIYVRDDDSSLLKTNAFLFLIHFTILTLLTIYMHTFYHENYQAAWVYFSTPNDRPRDILIGNLKAIVLKFYTPYFLLIAAVVLYFFGLRTLDDLVFAYLVSLCVVMLEVVWKSEFKIPFAKNPIDQQKGGQTMIMVSLLLVLPVVGLMHWGLTYLPFGVPVGCVVMALLAYLLYKQYEKINWAQFDL